MFDIVSPESMGFSSGRLAKIEPLLQGYIDRDIIAGFSTLVARKGEVVHFEQLGQRDKEANLPMTADTIFRIWSMTKPIVCTALMTLYEEGRFQLSEPLSKYIPAFKKMQVLEVDEAGEQRLVPAKRPILIRDILTHTAGFTYNMLDDSPLNKRYFEAGITANSTLSLEEMILKLAELPLAFQPGSRWHYSVGHDVVAYLIEVLADMPLADYLQNVIFKPLGMVDTAFFVPEEKQSRLAATYGLPDPNQTGDTFHSLFKLWREGYNERIDLSQSYPAQKVDTFARGGTGLFSTMQDYLRFAQMLLNQGELDGVRIIGRKTAELMHSNHLPPALLPFELAGLDYSGYGFGLGSRVLMDVAASQQLGSVGEFGWVGAATTYYWVDPKEALIGLFMSQCLLGFDTPRRPFQTLVYAALVD